MIPRGLALVLAAGLALVGWSGRALGDPKPWAVGVSAEDQDKALHLYQEGNAFLEQSDYKRALEKYQLALPIWDHPAIAYNAAVCLINLDRPVEAYEKLQDAMRFGPAPLGKDIYAQGQSYQKLLAGQIAVLEVRVDQPDAEVTLDGEVLLHDGVKAATRRVHAGEPHQIVAKKDHYQTETRSITVLPGKKSVLVLQMKLLAAPKKLVRRWNRWAPWSVVAGGAACGLVGAIYWKKAHDDFRAYDDEVLAYFNDPATSGQPLSQDIRDDLTRANTERTITFGMLAAGGALVAAGVAMVVLNQPHLEKAPMIQPELGPDHAGVVISARW